VIVVAELVLLYAPELPHRIGRIAIIFAVKFTGWHRHNAVSES
jgi:hypothetical protein